MSCSSTIFKKKNSIMEKGQYAENLCHNFGSTCFRPQIEMFLSPGVEVYIK